MSSDWEKPVPMEELLKNLEYPGDVILYGMTPEGALLGAYVVTGRDDMEKRRWLTTEADPSHPKEKIPFLKSTDNLYVQDQQIFNYFPALVASDGSLILGNGRHNELVRSVIEQFPEYSSDSALHLGLGGEHVVEGISMTRRLPDRYGTPRITAVVRANEIRFAVTYRSNPIMKRELSPGQGALVRTYRGGNAEPLQPFNALDPDMFFMPDLALNEISNIVYWSVEDGTKNGNLAKDQKPVRPAGIVTVLAFEVKDGGVGYLVQNKRS